MSSASHRQSATPRTKRKRGRSAHAQRGAELEFVRTAGPRAIMRMLDRLEARGEIVSTNNASVDERNFDLVEDMDFEVNLEDKDVAPVEIWPVPSTEVDAVVVGELTAADAPEADDVHELIVHDGICQFQCPEWAWSFSPTSLRAKEQLDEIAARSRVFLALADWLNCNRASFLKSRDFWDLGPASLKEAVHGCSTLQKDVLAMLEMKLPVREESFSRYLNQCELVWCDNLGSAPIQILFSKGARLAWVACAVVMFAREYPGRPLAERLEDFRRTKLAKVGRGSASFDATRLGAMKFDRFIQLVNQKAASTRWEEVLKQHRSRMLSEYAHGKKGQH